MAEVRAGEIAVEQLEPFFFVQRRDSRLRHRERLRPQNDGDTGGAGEIGHQHAVDAGEPRNAPGAGTW